MNPHPQGARGVLGLRDFRLFALLGFFTAVVQQAQAVAVGWDIYERTGSALALGAVGLVQFLPTIALFLPAGQIADRRDRRMVMAASQAAYALGSCGLAAAAWSGASAVWIYACLLATGTAQVMNRPSRDALLPQIVPAPLLAGAVALNSSLFQCAWIGGPAFAGLVIAITGGAMTVYSINLALSVAAIFLTVALGPRPPAARARAVSVKELFAGLAHVWRTRLVLGVMAVDLMAVLFAGTQALLPIFAKDVLHVGPAGLGWLSSAPALGALIMGLVQGLWRRPYRHAGHGFLWAVAGYGGAMMVFGVSELFWLSLVALFLTGAFDNLSVVVRQTVVQLHTPDELRGRVSAVNRVFVDASNQLGALRSGVLTAVTSPVFTVVAGGAITLLVVVAALRVFPEVRRMERL
jgi:MFS family permease